MAQTDLQGGAANWRKHDTYEAHFLGSHLCVRWDGMGWTWAVTPLGKPRQSGVATSAAEAMAHAEAAAETVEADKRPRCRRPFCNGLAAGRHGLCRECYRGR